MSANNAQKTLENKGIEELLKVYKQRKVAGSVLDIRSVFVVERTEKRKLCNMFIFNLF